MRKTLYLLLGMIVVILAGCFVQYLYCAKEDCPFYTKKDSGLLALFSLKNADFELNCKDNFMFRISSYELEQPISPKILAAMQKLRTYLAQNANIGLNIKGFYGDFESNLSLYSDLGLSRANAVKNYFIANGFNKKQLVISSEETDKIDEEMEFVKGGAGYSLFVENEDAYRKKLEALRRFKEYLQEHPLTLYFETGNSRLDLTPKEREAIRKIGEYLTIFDEDKLLIVGHSDNTGQSEKNKVLSKNRAEFVKSHFVKNGFTSSSIETVGEGADKPIATNTTKEGRAKNRRVEVTIK